ncbi:AHH domain-containing protein [Novosphingobium sp. G106]|nr:AHH domain-containing protein [Novosphingobium sp. G106]
MPFEAINRPGTADYDQGLQRHHLLPRQLLSRRCFEPMFAALGQGRIGFDDFRANGMLLPASDAAALRMAMPLHRGPHHRYSGMVIERVGLIETGWAELRLRKGLDAASEQALMQLWLVQRALRRRLLQGGGKRFALNRRDPVGQALDFSELDAMADLLWAETRAVQAAESRAESSAFAA